MGFAEELPLVAELNPLGFPVRLRSNSESILAAARSAWQGYPAFFGEPTIELHVAVRPVQGHIPARPVYCGREHLLIISAGEDCCVCDHTRAFAFCRLTEQTAAHAGFASYYYLEAAAYHLFTQLRLTPIHAACVAAGGAGILLCGPSGAGKSTLAYACARAGWTYVSDNNSWLVRDDPSRVVLGDPRRIRFLASGAGIFPEIAGAKAMLFDKGKACLTLEGSAIERAFRSRISHVVFLERGSPHGMRFVQKSVALERLMADVPMYTREVRLAQEESLRRLLDVETVAIGYDEYPMAIDMLSRMVADVPCSA